MPHERGSPPVAGHRRTDQAGQDERHDQNAGLVGDSCTNRSGNFPNVYWVPVAEHQGAARRHSVDRRWPGSGLGSQAGAHTAARRNRRQIELEAGRGGIGVEVVEMESDKAGRSVKER